MIREINYQINEKLKLIAEGLIVDKIKLTDNGKNRECEEIKTIHIL